MKQSTLFAWNRISISSFLIILFSFTIQTKAQSPANALDFDGTNDYVNISPFISYSNTFTLEGWIKTSSPSEFMFTWGNSTVNGYVHFGLNTGRIRLAVGDGSGIDQLDGISTINDNTWHHIAVVKNGTSVTFYKDGIADGTASTSRTPATITTTGIGAGFLNNTLQGFRNERLDNIRLWNVARTPLEIQSNMNCELGSQAGLVASYHFNQGNAGGSNLSDTTLIDASGNNHTGRLTNFALSGATSNWVASGVVLPVANYRSVASGNWTSPSTWETQRGACWVPATTSPTFADQTITIQSGHTVTISSNLTIDQTFLNSGGTITVTGGNLVINNGPGVDFAPDGTINWNNNAASMDVNSGALIDGTTNFYYHGTSLINNGNIKCYFVVGTSTPSTITGTGSIETLLPFSFDPGGIIINGNQTITSQLAFNYGKIHTVGASKIIIGNGAFVINGDATRYVDGNLEYYFTGSLGLTYNIGDVNKYLPVQFTPLISTPGGVSARTDAGDHPQINSSGIVPTKSVNRTWTIGTSGATLSGFYITLNWDASDLDAGVNTSNLAARMFNGSTCTCYI